MTGTTHIDESAFLGAVSAAVRAPSVYNTQPWRFALRDGGIEVRIDPGRNLPVADPDGWAARIACGAAIANIRLSLAVAGLRARTRLWPATDDPLLVASIFAVGECTPAPHQRAMYAAVAHRRSNRRPFFDATVPADARGALQSAARDSGAWLSLISDREPVALIGEIIDAADERLRRDPAYVAEMNACIGQHVVEASGIPPAAAGNAPASQDLLAMRDYGGAQRAEGRDFEADPLVGVLETIGHDRHDDVIAGSALQMVLLTATDARFATSMLSQPIEVPAARERLRRLLNRHGTPQMVIRVGFGQPVSASSRRPVESFIDVGG